MTKRFTFLVLAALATFSASAQNPAPCSDLFFSQYVEGSGNNKALEIYNPTAGIIDLSQYKVWISYNGGSSTSSIALQGSLNPNAAFVLVKDSAAPALLAFQDQTTASLNFNGNDAIALVNILSSDTIDVIGTIGEFPGTTWYTATGDSTHDQTLIRDGGVHNGNLEWNGANSASFEWLLTPLGTVNDFSNLGEHTMTPCGVVDDPQVSFAVASQTVNEDDAAAAAFINITFPNATATDVTVTDLGGTATAGVDYTFTASVVTFAGGSAVAQSVSLNITDDTDQEPTEYFVLALQNVTNNGTIDIAYDTIFIADNDFGGIAPILQLFPTEFTLPENTVDSIVIFNVLIGAENDNPTSVTVSIQPLLTTATLSLDFSFVDEQTVTFPANSSSIIPLLLTLSDDDVYEGDEQIVITLSNPTNNATLFNDTLTVNIIENDSMTVSVQDLKNIGMSVWPNPAIDRCTIGANETMERCVVYNATGQIVYTTNPFANRFNLDVSHFPAGLYVVEATTYVGTLRYRLMKR